MSALPKTASFGNEAVVRGKLVMRLMGIDYGEKRIGVALCDELGLLAYGLTVIQRRGEERDIADIAALVREHRIETLVVGYPVPLSGVEGIQCQKVNCFMEKLSLAVNIPLVQEDETCTTTAANEMMSQARTKRRKRRGLVDKIAATVILQSYLEKVRRRRNVEEHERACGTP